MLREGLQRWLGDPRAPRWCVDCCEVMAESTISLRTAGHNIRHKAGRRDTLCLPSRCRTDHNAQVGHAGQLERSREDINHVEMAQTDKLNDRRIAITLGGRGSWCDNLFVEGCGARSSTSKRKRMPATRAVALRLASERFHVSSTIRCSNEWGST